MSEKTEHPTPKKLRDARKEGNFLHSKEIVQASQIIFVGWGLWIALDHIMASLMASFDLIFRLIASKTQKVRYVPHEV